MTVDTVLKLSEALARLLGTIAWPVTVLLIVFVFRSVLRDLIENLGEFSFKGGGFEASGRREKAEATAALAAAAIAKAQPMADTQPLNSAQDAAEVVSDVVTTRLIRRASRASVLWVDDTPENNINERKALGALGMSFVLATSTDEALDKTQANSFDLIISDMGRPHDSHAGYTLLDTLRNMGDRTPFIIYARAHSSADQAEARKKGAVGYTSKPNDLFKLALAVIGRRVA